MSKLSALIIIIALAAIFSPPGHAQVSVGTGVSIGGNGTGNVSNQVAKGIGANSGGSANAIDTVVCTPPTTNGDFVPLYHVTADAAVFPTCSQVGVVANQGTGGAILFSDNNSIIRNPGATLSLATPATLENTNFATVITTPNGTATTITPTTWTISLNGATAGATGVCPAYASCRLYVDQVTSTQWDLDATYLSGHGVGTCSQAWGGSGTSFAMTTGDDNIVKNKGCYNDSGVTRTITAVKCNSDAASNAATVNPTFGADGTGTTILSGALTCGNSNANSATGTISNASWTTGTGINPAMGGTLTSVTNMGLLVEFKY